MSTAGPVELDGRVVRTFLGSVHDPEIPNVSILDLGIVDRVRVTDRTIEVELLPTFVGCPALDVIRMAVEESLAVFDRPVTVAFTWRVPWTSDRISDHGRQRLADRKSTRLNSSHIQKSRMPSSA